MKGLLLRRRHVWLPTLWGWLVLLALLAVMALLFARYTHAFLALNEPARGKDGAGARTLIVEGWMDEAELAQAIAVFRRGHYQRVLTTGGPVEAWAEALPWKTFAERGAGYLTSHGLSEVPVVAVPAPASAQDRSFLSAVMVREWAQRAGVKLDAIDLFTAGVHARRSRLLYRMALGERVQVGVFAARPIDFDPERWWASSQGAKLVMGETISLVWTHCCFWPAAPGSHEERWAVPPAAASATPPQ